MSTKFPIPVNEKERIAALRSYNILDTLPEEEYDNITRLAAWICEVPIAVISLIDEDRQWFKSAIGITISQTARNVSFCQYAIMYPEIFQVEDAALDARFAESPLVRDEPGIRFYAGCPIEDPNGHRLGTLCVIDRQPRKLSAGQAEMLQRLAEVAKSLIVSRKTSTEHDIFKKFFNLSLDMLCVAGTDAYFKIVNPSFTRTLGWTEEELVSRPFLDFIHPDDLKGTLKEVEKLSDGIPTIAFTNRYRKKDGNYVWMHWTAMPDPKTGDLYAVAHDVTSLIEANEQLNRAIRHKEIFLSNMSHEIRTPMNAIKGFAELLRTTNLNRQQLESLDTILLASDNLLVIINDILDVSKIESGKLTLDEKPFSIINTVEQVVRLSRKKADKKGLKIITSVDSEIPDSVTGDPVRLSQILVNLIGNGLKFTKAGHVEVKVLVKDISGDRVTVSFSVRDTGIGIPGDKLGHIFERFEQVSNATTREFGGTGLGLSIVKMLLELHGSEIEVSSTVGVGSEFNFDISYPVSEAIDAVQEPAEDNAKKDNILRNVRILLAEDNEMNQKLVEKYVMRHGASLEIASNGRIAVEKLQRSAFDVVVMDLQMPVMDGYQAAREIRQILHSDIPIIACTAHSLLGEKKKCLLEGMDDYVSKPFTEQELINSIIQLLPGSGRDGIKNRAVVRAKVRKSIQKLAECEGQEFADSLMEIYNDRIPGDLEALRAACAAHDLETVKAKAHLISSSLTALNFETGFKISKQLESAVVESRLEDVREYCHELIDFLETSLDVTRNYLSI